MVQMLFCFFKQFRLPFSSRLRQQERSR